MSKKPKPKNFGKFKALSKIGGGSFGKVYLCLNESSGQKIALKIEKKNKGHFKKEALFYRLLSGTPGIPCLYDEGYLESEDCQYLALELCGNSLETIYQYHNKSLSLNLVCLLSLQMIERLQQVHERGIVHRDMKPHNFMVGLGSKSNTIYLGDFGLAKIFNRRTGHILYKENKYCVGTARYVSINDHRGIQQSRRDDLESLGYVIIYLAKGGLPWQGLRSSKDVSRKKKVAKMKEELSVETLCSDLPSQVCEYIKYTRALKFEEAPNYAYLKRLFKDIVAENRFRLSLDFV
jgi:casein kinase 1 epsilon